MDQLIRRAKAYANASGQAVGIFEIPGTSDPADYDVIGALYEWASNGARFRVLQWVYPEVG